MKTVLLVLLIFVTACSDKTKQPTERQANVGVPAASPVQYTDEQMHAFWDAHLNQVIMVELVGDTYPLVKIQEHFQDLRNQIFEKYHQPLAIEISTSAQDVSLNRIGASYSPGGKPTVVMFMPAIMQEFYRNIIGSFAENQMLEVFAVSNFLHETEHLLQDEKNPLTKEDMIYSERDAWAKTCQYVLAVFVHEHYTLDVSDQSYFSNWVACGKENNQCWEIVITSVYSQLTKQFFKNP